MALQLRRGHTSSLGKTIATSFMVLALVAQPLYGLMASQVASAAPVYSDSGETATVSNEADIKVALANTTVKKIVLDGSITLSSSLLVTRTVEINGGGNVITGPSLGGKWISNGNNYVVKVWNAPNVVLHNFRVAGSNAGLLVTGSSTVELRGHVAVGGNVFGGIEVANGGKVSLTRPDASLHNLTEAHAKPTIWTVNGGIFEGRAGLNLHTATHIVGGQTQYYLDATSVLAVPTLTAPKDGAVVKGASVTNSWNAVTGANSYVYESYHDAAATDVRWTQSITGTSKTATNVNDATFWWRVKAVRADGAESKWSQLRKVTVDNTPPETTLNVSPVTNGKLTVSGTATDANGLNRIYLQLVSRSENKRCGGTTISMLNQGASVDWSRTYDIHDILWNNDTTGATKCAEGEYAAHVNVVDAAGNAQSFGWTDNFFVDMTAPAVTLNDITAITEGEDVVVTGATDPDVSQVELLVNGVSIGMVAVNSGQFSHTIEGLGVGTHDVVAIARDAAGNQATSLTKQVTVSAAPAGNNSGGGQNQGGNQNSNTGNNGEVPTTEEDDDPDTDGDAGTQVFTAPIVALGNQAVLGSQDAAANQNQSNQATSDVAEQDVQGASDEKQNGMLSPLGFAWYWWLLALAAIAGLWWLLAALRRRKGEE